MIGKAQGGVNVLFLYIMYLLRVTMPKQRFLLLFPLLFFVALAVVLWRGLSLNPQQLPSALINKPIPVFALSELHHPETLFSEHQLYGHVTLLNVWATWCSNCRLEHPVLIDISQTQHIPIYGLDYKDSRTRAIQWLQQYGNPYRAVGFDQEGKVAINFGVYGTPETFIIDQHGIIRFKHIGPITQDVWENEIKSEIKRLGSSSS
jgi:cytochrome c biogenesis protein CcmG/thiol:disulfide interchange protein DsbE